jgi:hypothetical protein
MRKVVKRAVCGAVALSFVAATTSQAAPLPIASPATGDAIEVPAVPVKHYRGYAGDPGYVVDPGYGYDEPYYGAAPVGHYGRRGYYGSPYQGYGYGHITPEQRYNIWAYRENRRREEFEFRQNNPGAIYVPGHPPRGYDPR